MVFNSLHFLVFFPLVTLGYFLLAHRFRWVWLLAASCYFYMAFIPAYILILLFTIAVDFWVALRLQHMRGRARKWMLVVSLAANIGVLAIFKYFYFIDQNLEAAARFLGWNYSLTTLSIILPIGLSFHTFQSMSYIIEVYRGNQAPARHIGRYALYVMYYPQLVAGPIERPQNLLHQLEAEHRFEYTRVRDGFQQMLWGMFKKVVIADQLATTVDLVYGNPGAHSSAALVVATALFAVQIYCDFSGYSDIAIGASRVMGINLMQNFRQPYFSASIAEFWRRWHISLSTWFRDYVYVALGGNRVGRVRQAMNLVVVFLVSGIWHGANWTFVVWGALHACYLVFGMATARARERWSALVGLTRWPTLRRCVGVFVTFTLVCVAWVFFRAASLADAWYIASHLTNTLPAELGALASPWALGTFLSGLRISKYTLLAIVALFAADALLQRRTLHEWLNTSPTALRWLLYYAASIGVLLRFDTDAKQFIYFQF
jgi:D-alanyl-lipoteichoic acid acyltransferase DltB (MBOAT superfamily)